MSDSTPTRAQRAQRHLMRVRGAGKLARDINKDIFTFSIPSSDGSNAAKSAAKRRKLRHDMGASTDSSQRIVTPVARRSADEVVREDPSPAELTRLVMPGNHTTTSTESDSVPSVPKSDRLDVSTDVSRDTSITTIDDKAVAKAKARARAARLFADSSIKSASTRTRSHRLRKQMPVFVDPPQVVDNAGFTTAKPRKSAGEQRPGSSEVHETHNAHIEQSQPDVQASESKQSTLPVQQISREQADAALHQRTTTKAIATPQKQLRRSVRAKAVVPLALDQSLLPVQRSSVRKNGITAMCKPLKRTPSVQAEEQSQPPAKSSARPALSSINPNKDLRKPIPADDKLRKVSAEIMLRQKIKLIAESAIHGLQGSDNSEAAITGKPRPDQSSIFDSASLMSFASRHHIMTVAAPAKIDKHDPGKLMLPKAIHRKRLRDEQEDMDVDDLITNIATLTKGVETRFCQDFNIAKDKSRTLR